jgi:hypothetical protein
MSDLKENMGRLRKEIESLIQEASDDCLAHSKNEYHCSLGKRCPFKDPNNHFMACMVDRLKFSLIEMKK